MRKLFLSTLVCVLFWSIAVIAFAYPTVDSDYQGWVASSGRGNGGFDGNNTYTGINVEGHYNSWASLDLTNVHSDVTSATLLLNLASLDEFCYNCATYTLNIYDVNTPLASFVGQTSGVAGYSDLMTGNIYGTVTGNYGLYSVELSSQAIADINAALGGEILFGFTNVTLNSEPAANNGRASYINGFIGVTGDPCLSPQLILSHRVPEPATMLLLASGLVGLAGVRRRFKK